MTQLPKKFYFGLGGAAAATAVILLYCMIFILGPQKLEIKAVEKKISQIEQSMVGGNGANSESEKLRRQIAKARETLSQYVVGSQQAADLAVSINRIAKQAGLQELRSTNRIENSYGPINECQYVREGRIQINFKSSFVQFAQFVNSLERNEPVIFVDYFKISRSEENAGRNDVEMVLTFFAGQESLKDILEEDSSGKAQAAAEKDLSLVR